MDTTFRFVRQFRDGSRGGTRVPGPPRYFWTKLRPERSKKKFKKAPPYLRVWMTAPALI